MNADPRELDRIQRWMHSVIIHADGVRSGIESQRARAEIDVAPDEVERVITRSRAQSSIERLQIYANAYYARLLECLHGEYPALLHAVGEEAFDAFAFGYLQSYPSRSYTLSNLSTKFPQYLEETRPPDNADERPGWPDFVVDLARLERAYSEVFDGPGVEDVPTSAVSLADGKRRSLVDPQANPAAAGTGTAGHRPKVGRVVGQCRPLLQESDLRDFSPAEWPRVRLVPVDCLRLMSFRFPVHEYASAVRRKEAAEHPASAPTFLAITRRRFVVRRFPLSRPQYELLSALVRGENVADSIAQAAETGNLSVSASAGNTPAEGANQPGQVHPSKTASQAVEMGLDEFASHLRDWFRDWSANGFFLRADLPD